MAGSARNTHRSPGPCQLNGLISRAERAQELLALHRKHGHAFDCINLATCWSKLGRVSAAERVWLQNDGGARLFALHEQTSRQARSLDARCV